jgi:TolA-binding protein
VLDYDVQGAVMDGDYVRAKDHPADITFSDQTRVRALPGARLRLGDLDRADGARVSLEHGKINVRVSHRESRSWRFEAGPFKVHVTGTRFALDWDADDEQLELLLHEGSVDIEGYFGSGVVSVHAGQRFLGDAKLRTMLVSDISGPVAPVKPTPSGAKPATETPEAAETVKRSSAETAKRSSAASASGAALALAPSASAPSRTSPAPSRGSWPELVSKGAFRQVVDQATAHGLMDCLAKCPGNELNALADAARYVGQHDLAEKALLALRARYAAAYGVRSAFLLGRLQERQGKMASARSWYERTLREGPQGAFASDALAGKMRTVRAIEGRQAARPLAREYLRRYPKGVHTSAARQLAEGP